jgi:predicted branched-subunit amino acid permease
VRENRRDLPSDTRGWFRRGLRQGLGVHLFPLFATFVGIGSLGVGLGFPLWFVILSCVIVNAGPAQVILISQLGAGASLVAALLAVSMSSVRFVPMVVSMLPMMRLPSHGTRHMLLASHFVAVTNWVEGMRRLPALPPEGRFGYFLGFGVTIMSVCCFGVTSGFFLARYLPTPLVAALFFMTPIYFTVAIARAIQWKGEWVALGIGLVLTTIGASLGLRGFELAISALVGGSAGFAVYRWEKRVLAARQPAAKVVEGTD